MAAKLIDWMPEITKAMEYMKDCKFSPSETFPLIDYLSAHRIVPRNDLMKEAAKINDKETWNFVNTTLGRVTMGIHGTGNGLPDPGGWYFYDEKYEMYVLDRGFSAAWAQARAINQTSD